MSLKITMRMSGIDRLTPVEPQILNHHRVCDDSFELFTPQPNQAVLESRDKENKGKDEGMPNIQIISPTCATKHIFLFLFLFLIFYFKRHVPSSYQRITSCCSMLLTSLFWYSSVGDRKRGAGRL